MPSSSSRPSRNLASPNTNETSSHATTLPEPLNRYKGPDVIHDPNSFEMQTASPRQYRDSKEEVDNNEEEGLLPSMRRPSLDSVQSFELYTPDEDRAVVKKLDRRLVVFMAFLYMLSFLDRSSKSSTRKA